VPIVVKLDDMLHDRRMTLANLSILKTGKARAVRFSTLDAICEALACQPGDILRFEEESLPRRSDEGGKAGEPPSVAKKRKAS